MRWRPLARYYSDLGREALEALLTRRELVGIALALGLVVLADGLKFAKPITVAHIYDGRFLPPAADRKFA